MIVALNKNGDLEARFSKPLWLAFLDVLNEFPCIPPAHRMNRPGKATAVTDEASQVLLDEALAEHRQQLKTDLLSVLADPARVHQRATTVTLTLNPADLECVLQVLNDVRVGKWIQLGSPEELPDEAEPGKAEVLHKMEAAGIFQSIFLQASQGG